MSSKPEVELLLSSIERLTSTAFNAVRDVTAMIAESKENVADSAIASKNTEAMNPSVLIDSTAQTVTGDNDLATEVTKNTVEVDDSSIVAKGAINAVDSVDNAVSQVVTLNGTQVTEVDIAKLKRVADEAVAKLRVANNEDVATLRVTVAAAIEDLKAALNTTVTVAKQEHVPFPKLIWQIWQTKPGGPIATEVAKIYKDLTESWTSMNPDWSYTLVDDDQANRLITDWYVNGDEVEIKDMFLTLTDPILRADLLRLLLLYKAGGLYLDLDTMCKKPIAEWGMDELTSPDGPRLVVGIERDLLEDKLPAWWHVPVQFNNWTIAARPGSPLLKKLIFRILNNLRGLATKNNTAIAKLGPLSTDAVLEGTGPVAMTRAVCRILEEDTGKAEIWHKDFHKLSKPYAFANQLLVYPKDCMAKELFPGEPVVHDPVVFLQHHFHHSWMTDKNTGSKEVQGLLEKGH